MIVYGDPAYQIAAGEALARLRAALFHEAVPTLDVLRALLIRAGELEQGIADALGEGAAAGAACLTDALAAAFVAAWGGQLPSLGGARRALDAVTLDPSLPLTVKVPEGFAFYALYPEQYALAAARWLAEGEGCCGPVVVVGIRSIGTTLSALVAARLRAAEVEVHRTTVRPGGHPFERTVALPPEIADGARWGLVVDEGPGHSGSSMAAVAAALHDAGLPCKRIVLFPGHSGEPGPAASAAVRDWWRGCPRVVVSMGDLRFGGEPLPQALGHATARLLGSEVAAIEESGWGQWRALRYARPDEWPALGTLEEGAEFLVSLVGGERVQWRFAGLAMAPGQGGTMADAALDRVAARAAWGGAPLGQAHGFVATPWLGHALPPGRRRCCDPGHAWPLRGGGRGGAARRRRGARGARPAAGDALLESVGAGGGDGGHARARPRGGGGAVCPLGAAALRRCAPRPARLAARPRRAAAPARCGEPRH